MEQYTEGSLANQLNIIKLRRAKNTRDLVKIEIARPHHKPEHNKDAKKESVEDPLYNGMEIPLLFKQHKVVEVTRELFENFCLLRGADELSSSMLGSVGQGIDYQGQNGKIGKMITEFAEVLNEGIPFTEISRTNSSEPQDSYQTCSTVPLHSKQFSDF